VDRDDFIARYLYRLGTNERALPALHLAHLRTVPFENHSIHDGERIQLDTDWLFDKLVVRRRGGFCYELNGLFAELLRALGHEVDMLAARVYGNDGQLGIPFDHMCLRVDGVWLADVGFGDNFITPLRLDTTDVQHDGRRSFRIADNTLEDDGRPTYVFETTPYALADFAPGCDFHQSPASHFARGRVISRLTADGRITLREDRLIVTDPSGKRETPITPAEYRQYLATQFGIA
jgi:N-hydroxyarylamine O-acetyltransferase